MNRIVHYVKKQQKDESSWSSNETRNNAFSRSYFNNIPNEIILHIFRFLSMRDLDVVSLVCRTFKIIADQEKLWRFKDDRK